MSTLLHGGEPLLEWAVAGTPIEGAIASGDLHVVAPSTLGAVVAVIDGLGHGPEAAEAARRAVELIEAHVDAPAVEIVQRCHEGLRKTRGVAMSLAVFDAGQSSMCWIGVGDVEGVLCRGAGGRGREGIPQRGGVVGYQLPPLRHARLDVQPGDTLIFATDGIRRGFQHDRATLDDPQALATSILERHAKGTDDACVLIARFVAAARADALLAVRDESDVTMVRKRVRELARAAGLTDVATEALATAASELARNILEHARGGEIGIAVGEHDGRRAVTVIARDRGPGIADAERALSDGFSTGGGLGLGLSSARRLVDEFELTTSPGQGTTVTMRKWLP